MVKPLEKNFAKIPLGTGSEIFGGLKSQNIMPNVVFLSKSPKFDKIRRQPVEKDERIPKNKDGLKFKKNAMPFARPEW